MNFIIDDGGGDLVAKLCPTLPPPQRVCLPELPPDGPGQTEAVGVLDRMTALGRVAMEGQGTSNASSPSAAKTAPEGEGSRLLSVGAVMTLGRSY